MDELTRSSIDERIFFIRQQHVMIDRDIAELYGIETKALNQQVKRNSERFPENFMFRLTEKEFRELVTDCDRFSTLKHSTVLPHAFTEQGVSGRSIYKRLGKQVVWIHCYGRYFSRGINQQTRIVIAEICYLCGYFD